MAKRARQETLDGMGTTTIPELTEKAREYVEVRDERMELTESEVELQGKLVAMMHEHKLTVYKDPDAEIEISLKSIEKAKVKMKGKEKEDE